MTAWIISSQVNKANWKEVNIHYEFQNTYAKDRVYPGAQRSEVNKETIIEAFCG